MNPESSESAPENSNSSESAAGSVETSQSQTDAGSGEVPQAQTPVAESGAGPGQSQASNPEDRRRSYRLNKVLGAEIQHEDASIKARLFVIDISATGFRATNQFELPSQCDLRVKIVLEPQQPPLECSARIVWTKELTMSGLFQFGLEFQSLGEEEHRRLESFIEKERILAQKSSHQTVDLGRPWTTIRD